MIRRLFAAICGVIIITYIGAIIGAAIGIAIGTFFYLKEFFVSGFDLREAAANYSAAHQDILLQAAITGAFALAVLGGPVAARELYRENLSPFSLSYWLGKRDHYRNR